MRSEGLMNRTKKFYKLGKIGFMQNSLQTPQAKYAYRLLEFFHYESTKCHLPVPFYMVLTHLVATFLLLQDAPTLTEVWIKRMESTTNMFACGT